jgi:hypothetical protein
MKEIWSGKGIERERMRNNERRQVQDEGLKNSLSFR